jgi:hypothetical protein
MPQARNALVSRSSAKWADMRAILCTISASCGRCVASQVAGASQDGGYPQRSGKPRRIRRVTMG